ncbi:alkyl hydroperoxide reductase [Carbonactinospora thermoautotrophica]|uniref:NHL domain-containing thioredoxin family protein n=1 Tax=Carbonactinospora thermoautotrophica TaxID=1469144 RepID=UPI00227124C5|nr:NHL domain-containing thioredoxin family protein [Carbonactinospora thermoautotrophica]MCX9192082.1 alkyl hydroperoxide reductase [Carbonactinospora thermoautotrophica]
MPKRVRLRAPELRGRAWINTEKPLTLADLRGRCVVLDFWTFCCINCLHVLDELRPLEEKYRDVLIVIGVHSPKFAHEADHDALVAAVERYDVRHPVLDDPELVTWKQYAVRAWPTLTVIDPEGYVVAQMAGEGHAHGLDSLLAELVAEHEAKGTLRRGDSPYAPPPAIQTELRFPGKVLALPGGTYLVSDSGHHSLVELAGDAETVLRRIGDGERGLVDGGPERARFSEPQGLCSLPPEVAGRVGYDVVVADTVNHALRGVTLATGEVRTLAGTGRQWWQGEPTSGAAREVSLSSPWDVAWYDGRVAVAMAGVHQLWAFDPLAGTVEVLAGTTNEGLVDGPAREAWFAQTSGLAVSADGRTLWLADSETSALRYLAEGRVGTAVGTGLFDFGHRDGPAGQALFQHPLGVTVLPDGSVAVLDTYNGAVRRYDPATGEVTTLATGLAEPSDAVVISSDLLVVESAAHRLTRIRLPEEAARVHGPAHRTQRPPTDVAAGEFRLEVVFTPPTGQKLDERYGPATRLLVSASPPELLVEGAGAGPDLARRLVLSDRVDGGVLHVSAMAASCDEEGEFPACHVHQQDWGIPVRVTPEGASRLALVLRGLDA